MKTAPRVLPTPRSPAHRERKATVDEVTIAPAGDPFTSAPRRDPRTERLTREARGIQLFEERGHDIQQVGRGLYSVPSCSSRGAYLVRYSDTAESCECGDHQRRGLVCKHLYAAALFAAKRRKAIRTGFAPVLTCVGVGDE
jgi:SWIM zinc finger